MLNKPAVSPDSTGRHNMPSEFRSSASADVPLGGITMGERLGSDVHAWAYNEFIKNNPESEALL